MIHSALFSIIFRYVDSYRGISVQLGGPEVDLKEAIDQSGLLLFNASADLAGAPNELMYLKQGEHLMKKGVYEPALIYLNQALVLNPESKVITVILRLSVFFDN